MAVRDSTTLNEKNFRNFTKAAIEQYRKKNLFADVMLWSHIISYYEKEIQSLKEKVGK
jgi:hypothetical protein